MTPEQRKTAAYLRKHLNQYSNYFRDQDSNCTTGTLSPEEKQNIFRAIGFLCAAVDAMYGGLQAADADREADASGHT